MLKDLNFTSFVVETCSKKYNFFLISVWRIADTRRIIKDPVGNYMFKVNYINTGTRYEICSKLTVKLPEQRRRQWRRFGVFIIDF